MTPAERARVREIVRRTRAEQGLPPEFPPEVCADVARLITRAEPIVEPMRSAQVGEELAS
jgi:hypothetical protein